MPRCRQATRSAVLTLHVPPKRDASADASEEKLAQLISTFPNLRCLIVSNVHSFDHETLRRLASTPPAQLHLLIARNCQNVTGRSLSNLVSKLPSLQFLDLSYTKGGAAESVIEAIAANRQLRVLRLRRTGLRSHDLQRLLVASSDEHLDGPGQLHCLDIRDNNIDLSQVSTLTPARPSQNYSKNHDDARKYESVLRNQLTGSRPGDGDIPNLTKGSIPILYLSGNRNLRPELIAFAKPILLDISSEHVIPASGSDHAPRTWASIVANADDLVELRIYARSLESFSLPVYSRPQSDSDPAVPGLPPTYEAAVGQQALPERMDIFLRSFESLRTLRLACIPARAENGIVVSAITDLLRAAALAANDAEVQAQDDSAAGDLLPNETVAERAKQLFPLEQIILEVQAKAAEESQATQVEDQDALLLRQAGQDDFSFFEDEKSAPARQQEHLKDTSSASVDVVKALIEWRTVRKSAWSAREMDAQNELASEHWSGQVLVVPVSSGSEKPVQEEEDPFSRLL